MKIVFMGTPDFSAGILQALYEAGHEIAAVVTQPDRPKGRKMELAMCPAKEKALALGLPVIQPESLREDGAAAQVLALSADLIVVAAFGQFLPDELLTGPKYGCVNVHASLLPAYRGASPIQQAILDGAEETGVTIMRMDSGLDTGDIIRQTKVVVEEDETAESLFDKLMQAGGEALLETIPSLADGTAVFTPQPEESPTPLTRRIGKESGRIDWAEDAGRIERQIRAYYPWPSAFTAVDGKLLRIFRAHVAHAEMTGEAGCVVRQDKLGIYVQTGRGILCLDEVQLAGKKRMATADFLRGYTIRDNCLGKGEVL